MTSGRLLTKIGIKNIEREMKYVMVNWISFKWPQSCSRWYDVKKIIHAFGFWFATSKMKTKKRLHEFDEYLKQGQTFCTTIPLQSFLISKFNFLTDNKITEAINILTHISKIKLFYIFLFPCIINIKKFLYIIKKLLKIKSLKNVRNYN